MSRTNRKLSESNPVKKYLNFSGSKGQIKFYQKDHTDADDKGNVYIDDIDFIVLDIKSSISGYNENASSGISSNLLDPYSVGKEEFIVKTKIDGKFGVFAQGIYKDIKEKLSTINGKFTTNVFALANLENQYEIVKLELNGASLSPWIELNDKLEKDEIYDLIINITKGQLLTRKGGKTVKVSKKEYDKVLAEIKKDPMYQRPVWFYSPKFTTSEISEELTNLAVEQDKVLQAYFNQTNDLSDDTGDEPITTSPDFDKDSEEDDLPF